MGESVFKIGSGPEEFSSVTWLAIRPEICFDVNGYYRAFGVNWKASRSELREAYLAKGGPESEYLTYVMKQLLDPNVRKLYDLMPLGSIFRDKYEEEKLKRRIQSAIWEEQKWRAENGLVELDETGLWNDLRQKKSPKPLATPDLSRYSLPKQWSYSYFIKDVGPDDERAMAWQMALIRSLSKNGLRLRLCVGLQAITSGVYALDVVNGSCVFFLGSTARIDDTAEKVAVDLRKHFSS